jgi:chromate transport protein ChrA
VSETLQTSGTTDAQAGHGVSLGEAFRVWLRVAALSFGGPAGQIAVMHRILVEEKRWISEGRFLHALNYCMLLPGPEAQQLATYVGWLMHRTLGGIMAGGLFILPGIIAIMALSWIYALYGQVGFVSALFFGLKAAVLAIVLEAVVRIGKRALKNHVLIGLAVAAFVAIFFLDAPFPLIILAAGVIGFFGGRAGLPQFQIGGHGGNVKRRTATCLRDVAQPCATERRAQPARRPPVAGPLARAGGGSSAGLWRKPCVQPDCGILLQDGDGHLRRGLCGAGLCGAAGGGNLRLAQARRDAGRARHGGDHARAR